jgi:hypothetical protein
LEEEEFVRALAREVRRKSAVSDPETAARHLFDVPPRSGWYRYSHREGVVPLDKPFAALPPSEVAARVTREYMRFCEAIGRPGDCRRVLTQSPVLTGDGRYALGMSFAVEEIVSEMMQSFKDMADPELLKASLYWTMTIYEGSCSRPQGTSPAGVPRGGLPTPARCDAGVPYRPGMPGGTDE